MVKYFYIVSYVRDVLKLHIHIVKNAEIVIYQEDVINNINLLFNFYLFVFEKFINKKQLIF